MANFNINDLLKSVNQEATERVKIDKGSKLTLRICPGKGDASPFERFSFHYDVLPQGRCVGWWDDPAKLLSTWLVSIGRKLDEHHPLKQKLSDHFMSDASSLRGQLMYVYNVIPRRKGSDPTVMTFEMKSSVHKQIWEEQVPMLMESAKETGNAWNFLDPEKGNDTVVQRGERWKAVIVAAQSPIGLADWEDRCKDLQEHVARTVKPITPEEMVAHLSDRWDPVIQQLGDTLTKGISSVEEVVKGKAPVKPTPPNPEDLMKRS